MRFTTVLPEHWGICKSIAHIGLYQTTDLIILAMVLILGAGELGCLESILQVAVL